MTIAGVELGGGAWGGAREDMTGIKAKYKVQLSVRVYTFLIFVLIRWARIPPIR